ncbi:MAG TPA: muconolactone Delta-isomerase family protein [Ktedonobacteraceae bacterium]|jgi:muconolactone D-isomerase|nr:muconolactone Delta-isomerase family protein [Ktedonobacteraceae bacterium]
MLYYFKVRVDHQGMTLDELWDLWEKEAGAALPAMEAGKLVALYKISGQRRVVGIIDAESHDELDQIFMAGLPMSHYLEFEEILPVRPYEKFADDVKRRWK